MIVNCKNILSLPYVNQLNMVAGEAGKYNIIKNVHVVEEMSLLEFVAEGELVLCMGCTLTDRVEDWIKLIESVYDSKAAGFVICLGVCLKSTPKELIDLCNNLEFPLFELRREIRISDVIYNIYQAMFQESSLNEEKSKFFGNIIDNMISLSPKRMQKAEQFGYKIGTAYEFLVLVIDSYHFDSLDVKKEIETVCEYDYLEKVESMVNFFLSARKNDKILVKKDPYLLLLLPMDDMDNRSILSELVKYLESENVMVRIAGGFRINELEQLAESYKKAMFVLKALQNETNRIIYYHEMKMQSILYEVKNKEILEDIMHTILDPLLQYDTDLNLYSVLREYLKNDCNIKKTADALFIHANTLRYRLEKVEACLGVSLKEFHTLYDLKLAADIYEYLNDCK